MSAEEMKEFLAAMEVVRQANAAFLEVAGHLFDDEDDDLNPHGGITVFCRAPTIH